MFDVRSMGGQIQIILNSSHPVYPLLESVAEAGSGHVATKSITRDPSGSASAARILLESWAKYEVEQPSTKLGDRAQETRVDWGRTAKAYWHQPG